MMLLRTEKARQELRPGIRTLSLKERSVLLLADGSKTLRDLQPLFEGEGEQIVLGLVRQGYLEPQLAAKPAAPRVPAPLPAAAPPPAHAAPQPPAVSADAFEGKRSLATTRMFLFDICERMFARRDPPLAARFRDALREARERDAMLAVAREMLEEVEKVAGAQRADSISERIAMLLPPERQGA